MSAPRTSALVSELAAHPTAATVTAILREHVLSAASELQAEIVANGIGEVPETEGEAAAALGDMGAVLKGGAKSEADRALLAAGLALALSEDFPSAPETEHRRCVDVTRLCAHQGVDVLSAVDAALGDKAATFWSALGQARKALTPGEALVAAHGMNQSDNPSARRALDSWVEADQRFASLRGASEQGGAQGVNSLAGELQAAPRHPALTVLLAVTGILFFTAAGRALARLALGYRRPAELRLSERGLELEHRTQLLGRVLRSGSTVVPLANLARVTREIRFARLGLYAGLLALCLGSYLGMGLLVDGARVPGASPPLLGMGLVLIGVGIALDFGLSALGAARAGKCRLVVVPKKGPSIALGALESARADALLRSIAERAKGAAAA